MLWVQFTAIYSLKYVEGHIPNQIVFLRCEARQIWSSENL